MTRNIYTDIAILVGVVLGAVLIQYIWNLAA
jgi:hypothetical protein